MRNIKLLIAALTCMFALAACSDGVLDTTTTVGGVETTEAAPEPTDAPDDVAGTVAEVQTEMTALATEVQNSAAAADLEESWNALQTEVLAAVASLTDGGTIDGEPVQNAIDDFQSDLDALGEDVEPTLVEAWNSLKSRLESLMS